MRALLLAGLLTASPLASAQAVRSPAAPDSTSAPEARGAASPDTLVAPEAMPQRSARFAFPTEGGVFYYRAGSGTGVRRRSASGAPAEVQPDSAPAAFPPSPLATAPGTPSPATAPETSRVTGQTATLDRTVASGVTQRDLDRLENRLLDALDRRLSALARDREVVQRPGSVAAPTDAPPRGEATVLVPVPVPAPQRPIESLPERPRDRTPEATPPLQAPIATVEEIERDILDTGLFRTTFVNFEFAKAALLPFSEQTLDALTTVLLRYPALRIEIGGHTDNVGSDETNDALSQRRAESVAAYLAAQGVAHQRLTAVGYGENRPVASNENETGRALNRRVEFRVLNPEDAQRIR
ncbi:OmpA family protein [Rubricoccus marinus]|uniref:OmpA-like domain-containing protein n=1 Tax=Rubricoccus marinus TaxID=716817 RepID=A0A259TZP0_9BACT|nr:OmpA family protein [Rubricoccus marinus]OZC03243.1 hypothetical protein BSZ36_09805 [Rubricoccus marinus]